MKTRREEDHRYSLRRVAVMIAPVIQLLGIGRIVHLVVERERLRQAAVGRAADLVQLAADPIGADQVHGIRLAAIVVAIAADHVDIELGHDRVDRDRRVVGEVPRSVQARFLAGVPHEDQRSLRRRSFAKCPGEGHQRHRARAVVVGAVPDVIAAGAGGDAAGGARRTLVAGRRRTIRVADVIVVGADRDVGVLQPRVAALDDGDDVVRELGPDDLVVDVDIDRQAHVVQAERWQRLLRRRFPFELVITGGRPAEEECQEFVRTGDVGSNRLIEPARRREVDRHVG